MLAHPDLEPLLTRAEAMRLLRYRTPDAVTARVRAGDLAAVRIGNRLFITRESVQRLLTPSRKSRLSIPV